MALDFSGNDSPKTASKGGLLSLRNKGKSDDTTFGSVGSKGDAADYYQYSTNKGLQQVKVELDISAFGSRSLLSQGGVAGVTDHIEISGSGAFKGKSLALEVRIGLNGIMDEFTALSDAAADLQTRMLNEYVATGGIDGILMEKIQFNTSVLQTVLRVFEHDRIDVDVNDIVRDLKSLLVDPSLQGGAYRQELLKTANGFVDVLEDFYQPHYVKIVNGKETEISAAKFANTSIVWNAKGGKPGYLIVKGYSEATSIYEDDRYGLDYTARVSVKSEKQNARAADFGPAEPEAQLPLDFAADSFDFLF